MSKLFVHHTTLDCAAEHCIPCLYKICPNGQYLTYSLPPNQRPEMCPRSKSSEFTGLYNSSQSVLTVGDGDFSFSLSIAEHLYKTNKQLNMVATSHESFASVSSTYPSCLDNLRRLKQVGVTVLHGVDATTLSSTAALDSRTFDIILWNFPCVRIEAGADGQSNELDFNKDLLRRFFDNSHVYLNSKGEVHVTHKTIEPFSWWGITTLAEESGMREEGRIVFDKYNYPGYINRKVLDKKSFPSNDAQTFVFMSERNRKSEKPNKKDKLRSKTLKNDKLLVPLDDETVQQRIQRAVLTVIENHNRKRNSGSASSSATNSTSSAKKRKLNS